MEIANSRRPAGFGSPMPVPLTEVAAAYEYYELAEHFTRKQWADLVAMCDDVVLTYHNKKAEEKARAEKAKKRTGK